MSSMKIGYAGLILPKRIDTSDGGRQYQGPVVPNSMFESVVRYRACMQGQMVRAAVES